MTPAAAAVLGQRNALHRAMARENCAFYASEFLRSPSQAEPFFGRFQAAAHHVSWADLINEYKKLVIIAARGHGKSFMFSFAYPLWMAERSPGQSGYIFSASQPQAEEMMIRIAREVTDNPLMQHMKPRDTSSGNKRWSARTLEFANGFTLHGRGWGTKVRGGHPIFILLDDILNDETAYSALVRKKQNDYFFNAVRPMLEPGGQIIAVGTPMHRGDIYGELRQSSEYEVREYPAIDANGNALWPERFPLSELKKIREEVKSLRFAREYMCQAVVDMSSLFPLTMFRGEPIEQHSARLGMPIQVWRERFGIKTVVIGVDFAISTNIGADYTVVFVIGIDEQGNRWVMDILRERGLAFQDQKQMIVAAAKKYHADIVYAEAVQMQRIFTDELLRETDIPIKPFYTTDKKHSLEQGLPSLRVLMENGKLRIPRGDEYSIETTNVWIEEMRGFTVSNGKVLSVSEHDDTAMAFWIGEQAARAGSFVFSFGEQPGDQEAFEAELRADDDDAAADPWWRDTIPGAVPRPGNPGSANAALTDQRLVDQDLDNPRNLHGNPKARVVGYERPDDEEKDWRPEDKSPSAKEILGLGTVYGVW